MIIVPNSYGSALREMNDCHNPAGPGGGQFCSKGGGPEIAWSDDGMAGRVRLSENREYTLHFREEFKQPNKYNQPIENTTVTKADVDFAVEHRAIAQAFDSAKDFWQSNDPDARWIKRKDGDYPEPAGAEPRLHAMLVLTLDATSYGAGSGGPGSAKVFWGPYSAPRRFDRLKTNPDDDRSYGDSMGVDPVYVLVHELHHAWRNDSEFDFGSDIVALDAHLKLGIEEKATQRAVRYALGNLTSAVTFGRRQAHANRAGRGFRYLYKRNPEAIRKLALKEYEQGGLGLTAEEFDGIVAKAMAIGKRRPKAAIAEADIPLTGKSVLGYPTRCMNARRKT